MQKNFIVDSVEILQGRYSSARRSQVRIKSCEGSKEARNTRIQATRARIQTTKGAGVSQSNWICYGLSRGHGNVPNSMESLETGM